MARMSETSQIAIAAAVTGVILLGSGLLMLWLARRSAAGRLRRQTVAGIRTTLTLSSDVAWYPAQRAAAPRAAVAGWGSAAGGLALLAVGAVVLAAGESSVDAALAVYVVLTFGTALWLLVWVIASIGPAHRAAREAVRHEERTRSRPS